jgi:outer membrane receptor protein involved in Fe transport
MSKFNHLSVAIRLALLAGTAAMFSTPVFAQSEVDAKAAESAEKAKAAADDAEANAEANSENTQKMSTVVVTASRLVRAGFDTLEPAFTVDRDYVTARGLTNIADALNELPGFGIGATPEGGQSTFGVGLNFVNRFGLGTARTLTVIDGRRVVSANQPTIFGAAGPGLQVDLNIVPTQLIERVDSVAIGGAPTYGADAIAGVVNVVLRRDYEGLELGGAYGLTEHGDNERTNASVLWGKNLLDGRANLTFSASFDTIDGVLSNERDFPNAAPFFGVNNPASSFSVLQPNRTPANDGRYNPNSPFGSPAAVFARDRRLSALTPGGLLFPVGPPTAGPNGCSANGGRNRSGGLLCGFGPNQATLLQFAPGGNIVPYNGGTPFGNTDASGGDGWNLIDTQQLTSELDRNSISGMGRFDFTDSVTGFMDLMYYEAESFELVDQNIFNATQFGGLSGPITFRLDDPRLTDQARAALVATGLDPQTGRFTLSRASSDLVQNNGRAEVETSRVVAGVRGDFEAMNRGFNWEVAAVYGKSDNTSFQSVLHQQRFVNAMNVTRDASGNLVCAGVAQAGLTVPGALTPIADAACRPLNIFGFGTPSSAARDYVRDVQRVDAELTQKIFTGFITGDLFTMYSGTVPLNIGYEHREEDGSFTPNEFARLGLGRSAVISPLSGAFETDEFFAETFIPLIDSSADLLLLKRLDITLKGRRVDNSVNGATNAHTVGLEWAPIDDLLFRGNRTSSLRAPAITELFSPSSPIFTTMNDACDSRFLNSAPPGFQSNRSRNCAAFLSSFGLPATGFQSNIVGATAQGTNSGDPTLENELGRSYTIGFVYSPSFVPGLRVNADYYDIEITNAISNLAANAIASGCFDNSNFNTANIASANSFCERITRDAAGQVTNVRTGFVNGGITNFRGMSAELDYGVDLADWNIARGGNLRFGLNAFRYLNLETSANGVTIDRLDTEVGQSDNTMQVNVAYEDPIGFGVRLQGNYIGPAVFDVNFTPATRDILEIDSQWTFNASGSYRFNDNLLVRLSVTNLFDEEPPFGLNGAGAVGVYDLLGRRYLLSAEYKF